MLNGDALASLEGSVNGGKKTGPRHWTYQYSLQTPNIIAELPFKGGAHMRFVDALDIRASTKRK